MRWIFILLISLLIISSCTSSSKPPTTFSVKEGSSSNIVRSVKGECEAEGNSWDHLKKEGSFCNPKTSDFGKRCRSSGECKGFCQGNNETLSSGECSQFKKKVGCIFIIEKGERFEVCYE